MSVLTPNVTGSLKEPYIAPIVCVTVNRAIASKCIKRTPLPVKNPPPVILSNTANYAAGIYYVKAGDKKTKHICAPDKCVHCRERLTGQGSHQCFIQPLEPKEPCEKYIFYDFETRYENGRHVANLFAQSHSKGRDLRLRVPTASLS